METGGGGGCYCWGFFKSLGAGWLTGAALVNAISQSGFVGCVVGLSVSGGEVRMYPVRSPEGRFLSV